MRRQATHQQHLCSDCMREFMQEMALQSEVMYGTDPKGERWLDRIPEGPSAN